MQFPNWALLDEGTVQVAALPGGPITQAEAAAHQETRKTQDVQG